MPDYALMNQYLYEGKAAEVKEMTERWLAEGTPVAELLNQGLIAGMKVVGEDFKRMILYVPEVLIAARAMKAGMVILKPLLVAGGNTERAGTLVIGTVKGDLHDIGKNLVCMMAEGAGFDVHDLGVDCPVDKYIAAAREHEADVVGMSALLTTTMGYMKTVIDGFEEAGLGHIPMAVGGAPVSPTFAGEIGADGYGADAPSAVDTLKRLVDEGKAKREQGAATTATVAYQVLYWQDIPAQVRVESNGEEIKLPLDARVQQHIDQVAMKQGLFGTDEYLNHWRWSDPAERPGTAQEVAEGLKRELEDQLDLD
jgi:5-methyltetrahydrofolate--homocysteine methyltransferase